MPLSSKNQEAALGRPKGSVNKPKSGNGKAKSAPTETRHDNVLSAPLTDEQLEALTSSWASDYKKALAKKKTADSELKNCVKKAKSEGIKLADIKAYIDAESEEGQAKLREEAERVARVARWFKFAVQADLFDAGPPETNRSHRLGLEAGMAGEPANVPMTCDHEAWMAGWQEGQARLASGIQPTEDRDFN